MKRGWLAAGVIALSLGLGGWWYRPGEARLDAEAMAAAETRMWQAYYEGEGVRLGAELIGVLRSQFGLSRARAWGVGRRFAAAALIFRDTREDYESQVLPLLTDAYRRLDAAVDRPIRAEAAARAELAWWVARREPGRNHPEQVGLSLATLYAALYGGAEEDYLAAGLLRAWAAAYRDREAGRTDWEEVERQLHESYRELLEVIGEGGSRPRPSEPARRWQ